MKKKSAQKQLLSFIKNRSKPEKIKDLISLIKDPRALDTEIISDNYIDAPLIFHALSHRRKDISNLLQIFFDAGVSPQVQYMGKTLLHAAAGNQDKPVIDFLLEHGLHINAKDENEETALDYVIFNRYAEEEYYKAEKELIKLGAKQGKEINGTQSIWEKAKNQTKGFSPLRPEVVERLKEIGIRLDLNKEILTTNQKPGNYLSEPTWYWSEITADVIENLLYCPIKYREPDDMLDERMNHFKVGTLIHHNKEKQAYVIIEQWETGSAGGTYGYGENSGYNTRLASIGKAYSGRRVKK